MSALHGLHLHNADRPPPNALLKTAISEVSASHFSADANILFDEGVQRSFITQKLADDLQIQHKGTVEINLSTFGGSSQTLRRERDNSNRCIDHANHSSTVVQHAIGSHKLNIPESIETGTAS